MFLLLSNVRKKLDYMYFKSDLECVGQYWLKCFYTSIILTTIIDILSLPGIFEKTADIFRYTPHVGCFSRIACLQLLRMLALRHSFHTNFLTSPAT